jgi:hypothetical protein
VLAATPKPKQQKPRKVSTDYRVTAAAGATGDSRVLSPPRLTVSGGNGIFEVTVRNQLGRWLLKSKAGCTVKPAVVDGRGVVYATVRCAAHVSNPRMEAVRR